MNQLGHRRVVVPALLLFGLAYGLSQPPLHAQGSGAEAWTADEAEALDLYRKQQMVSARSKSEEALKQSPDSFVAHFVLGAALHEGEGSLARAMFHLGRARELYETRWQGGDGSNQKSELHRELLFKVQALAGELELHEYRLHVLGYHDYLYDPDLLSEQAWALIPLSRFDEARDFANRATEGRDPFERSSGLNALCAIEGESGARGSYQKACEAALEFADKRASEQQATDAEGEVRGGIAVHAYNAAWAALTNFDFSAAEQLAMRGTQRLEITPANPWRFLVRLYLDQGKGTKAVEALREMNRWRRRQPAYLRDQARAETDVALATVLLVTGNTEQGLRIVDRALAQPDRRGLTSSSKEQALGAHSLLHRAYLLQARAEREEEACFEGFLSCWSHRIVRFFSNDTATFEDEERIRGVLEDGERLTRTFRAYAKGGLEPLPSWLRHDLLTVLGRGISARALENARREETARGPGDNASGNRGNAAVTYLDAIEAEIALHGGAYEEAVDLATEAMDTLPSEEQLLRGRLWAVRAKAELALGLDKDAMASMKRVLEIDGSIFRRMNLHLPAQVTSGADAPVASEAADMIARSPRFSPGPGFHIRVSQQGGLVRACLLSEAQQRIRCASVQPAHIAAAHEETLETYSDARKAWEESGEGPPPEVPERPNPAHRLAKLFHQELFSIPVELSSADLTSLDGRVTTGAEEAREQMRGLLDQAMNPPP